MNHEFKRLNSFIPLLMTLLFVCFCLLAIGCSQDVDSLAKKLKHKDPEIRAKAVAELGEMGDRRAVDSLIAALQDENRSVQVAAMWSLGMLKDPRAIEPLIKSFANSQGGDFLHAASALQKIGEPAVEPVIAALKHQDQKVRRGAACALRGTKDPRAVEPLIQALKDENSGIQRCAGCALGAIKDLRAVEPLIEALKDRGSNVRESALRALRKITEQRFGDNPEQWRKWWEENKETFIRPKSPSKD